METLWTMVWTVLFFWVMQISPSTCQTQAQESCTEPGWFGENCRYKCHCENNYCQQDGNCHTGVKCVKGWFGPSCQYVDLTYTESTSAPHWLSDGDDTTCASNPQARLYSVTLSRPFPLTWLRIQVHDSDNGDRWKDKDDAFSVRFKTRYLTPDYHYCNHRNLIVVDNNTLDIYCSILVPVQEVELSGQGVKSLCSLYISGGRNVALRQNTNQSSTDAEYDSAKAVDGNNNGNFSHGSCTHTDKDDLLPTWTVTLNQPYMINRYVLYNRVDDHQERLQHFTLRPCDKSGDSICGSDYYDRDTQAQSVYNITYYRAAVNPAVSKVTIEQSSVSSPILTLCEVEMYGDCPRGKYGLTCEDSCGEKCFYGECSPVTGQCFGCYDGFTGHKCENRCSGYCILKCDQNSEKCIHGCLPGNYGDKCDKAWPQPATKPAVVLTGKNLVNRGEPIILLCKATGGPTIPEDIDWLKDGTFLKATVDSKILLTEYRSLEALISNLTIEHTDIDDSGIYICRGSDKIDSIKVTVLAAGTTNVKRDCPATYYGQDCIDKCSINCVNQLCNNVDGRCGQCVPGKSGDMCNQDCSHTTYGQDCVNTCNINCVDQDCNPVSGVCVLCPPGKIGDQCDQELPKVSSTDVGEAFGVGLGLMTIVCIIVVLVKIQK